MSCSWCLLSRDFRLFGTMARFAGKGALRATRVENEQARVIVVGWDPLSTKTALYWGLDRTSPLQPFDHSKVVLRPRNTLDLDVTKSRNSVTHTLD